MEQNIQYCVGNSQSLDESNPHIQAYFLRYILILSSHVRLGLPCGLFPSGFPVNTLYACIISPMRTTYCAHLVLFNSIVLEIFGENCKLLSSSF
jgi:hypothetical protein